MFKSITLVLLSILSVSLAFVPNASAQGVKSYPVSFRKVVQEEESPEVADSSLAEQLEEMKARLEELEYDLKEKIAESKEGLSLIHI